MIGRLLCLIGYHDWSCDMSLECRGGSDHYCRRCLYGWQRWLTARVVTGDL